MSALAKRPAHLRLVPPPVDPVAHVRAAFAREGERRTLAWHEAARAIAKVAYEVADPTNNRAEREAYIRAHQAYLAAGGVR